MAWEIHRLYQKTDLAEKGVGIMGGHADGLVAFGNSIGQAAERLLGLNQNGLR